MKIDITIAHKDLLEIIASHVSEATGLNVLPENVTLFVKSQENYRLKTWEKAEFIITNVDGMNTIPMHPDTELKAEVSNQPKLFTKAVKPMHGTNRLKGQRKSKIDYD